MPVSDDKKRATRESLIGYDRPYQHTAAAGVALYNDGNYGDIMRGKSGGGFGVAVGETLSPLVKLHRLDVNTGRAKNDAEVHVLNALAKEIFYWSKRRILATDVYLYVVGPHDLCKACKLLIQKFVDEYGLTLTWTYQHSAH